MTANATIEIRGHPSKTSGQNGDGGEGVNQCGRPRKGRGGGGSAINQMSTNAIFRPFRESVSEFDNPPPPRSTNVRVAKYFLFLRFYARYDPDVRAWGQYYLYPTLEG